MGDIFWVAKISNIFLGCLKFLIFILGWTVDAGPQPTMKKNENTPTPLGLKRLVINYYFAFSCRPLGVLVMFPCERGGGAQQLQCKSESAQCSEKQDSPCEGDGDGGRELKIWKKMLEKQ